MKNIKRLIEGAEENGGHIRLEVDGFLPLSCEIIGEDEVSIAHYGIQNGDLMADPEMTFRISDLKPLTFLNHYAGYYTDKIHKNDEFIGIWDRNIEAQGFIAELERQQADKRQMVLEIKEVQS
jgi:hypothetical protein